MGNAIRCISGDNEGRRRFTLPSFKGKPAAFLSSLSFQKKNKNIEEETCETNEDDSIRDISFMSSDRAPAAAFVHHNQANGHVSFHRTVSETAVGPPRKHVPVKRSSSSSQVLLNDHSIRPHQLVNQAVKINELETSHFVLVHGGGFGAWSWYKTVALLEEAGFRVDAVNLTGSGPNLSDANNVCSLAQYLKPVTDVLDKLGQEDKVVLVGHDLGGACISYGMEQFPSKIAKAVFVAATMPSDGQSALDLLSQTQQTDSEDLMQKAYIFLYADGKENPATSIDLDKEISRELLFNRSSMSDKALAAVSMRSIPFGPAVEKLCLSEENYGSITRLYIKTLEDHAILASQQESHDPIKPSTAGFPDQGFRSSPILLQATGFAQDTGTDFTDCLIWNGHCFLRFPCENMTVEKR